MLKIVLILGLATVAASAGAALPPIPPAPAIAARGHMLIDFQTGQVLAHQNEHAHLEPASLTKLMTSYVVFRALKENRLKLTDEAFISKHAWKEGGAGSGGSATFLPVLSRVPVEVLLEGMIIQSGNDASIALAEHLAGSEDAFATLMNQQAKELGMQDTHFTNAAGLPDPQHYTSPADVATLSRAIIRDFPEYYHWYSQKEFTYNGIKQGNRNLLLYEDPTVDGLKTGHTDSAGFCLASSAKRDNMRLIAVVMGTASQNARATASAELLNYGFRVYESRKLADGGKSLGEARVWKGPVEKLGVGPGSDVWVTVPRGAFDQVQKQQELPRNVIAPVKRGAPVGTIRISLAGQPLMSAPLVALTEVPEGSLWRRTVDTVLLWFE